MKLILLAILLVAGVSVISGCGCGGDAQAQAETEDDSLGSCAGFGAADINVFVRDSLNNSLVEHAIVRVVSEDGEQELTRDALYTASDDGIVDTLTGAYYTLLSLNTNIFQISLVVFADGYHAFVTKDIDFELNTSCGANNSIIYDVYLCPLGTACL